MIDGASEQVTRWVREQACEADFGSETHGETSFVIADFVIAGLRLPAPMLEKP
jgi:hypothetical protein